LRRRSGASDLLHELAASRLGFYHKPVKTARRKLTVLLLSDDRVKAEVIHCPIASPNRGHATVRARPHGPAIVINDRDVDNNNCVCR